MTTNDRPPGHRRPFYSSGPRPAGDEKTLKLERLHIERKTFTLALKENPRGLYVRITEDVGSHWDTIIVPAAGLEEFIRALEGMAEVAGGSAAGNG
jgi:hypothetical protein